MSWVKMAVTLAGVASALVSLQYTSHAGTFPNEKGGVGPVISSRTVDVATFVLVPLSLFIILYAAHTFWNRSRNMHNCQVRLKRGANRTKENCLTAGLGLQ